MKILDIATKDLLHSLRSAFLLVMMFVAPLLITGLIYLAFGGLTSGDGGISLPRSTVLVVNGDQPAAGLGVRAGDLLAQYLTGPELATLFDAQAAPDEAAARAAVESHGADVAVIIPPEFSAAAVEPGAQASVTVYHHPDNAIGARVVKVVVSDFVDGFAGAKIAVHVASHQLEALHLALPPGGAEALAQAYVAWLQAARPEETPEDATAGHAHATALVARLPQTAERPANAATLFLGPVMAGMMIFFMFFTGAAAAQSILYEDQDGTLARLFTTPTPRWVILAGKLVAVIVTLALQAVVLLAASALVFGIRWGQPGSVVLLTASIVLAAAGFGILLMSFVRTPRQAGPVIGLVVTLTGLMGGLMPMGDPSQPPPFERLTLALPQGWAQHGWRLVLAGGSTGDLLLPALVLAVVGTAFFAAGALLFDRRFAGGA
jgi:ABC-2 type transport system permease protein